MRRSTCSSAAERHRTGGRCRGPRRPPRVGAWRRVEERRGPLLQVCWESVQQLSRPEESSSSLLLPPLRRCRHGKLGETVVLHGKKAANFTLMMADVKMRHISACALTLFGADGVKVPAAASVVQTHVVALTLGPCVEGAAAPPAGLCENAPLRLSVFRLNSFRKIKPPVFTLGRQS